MVTIDTPSLPVSGCPGHHVSEHHMASWPLVWRPRLGYCDRICPHGVPHPDPDDVVRGQSTGGVDAAHWCDGCCIAPLRQDVAAG